MELTQNQVSELKRAHGRCRDRRSADRIKAVLMLGDGYSCEQISDILLMDDDTVRGHGKRYVSGGVPGLLEDGRKGTSPKLAASQIALLEAHLSERAYASAMGVAQWIYENFAVRYTRSGVIALLHRMGHSYNRPKKMAPVGDVGRQRDFVESYNALVEGLGPDDVILFMDGVHPLHNTVAAHGWFKKGKAVHLPSNTGRKRVNINGALDIKGKRVSIMECHRINAQEVIVHLGRLATEYPTGKIHIVLDNARYYRSKVVRAFLEEHPRIGLVFLPPYCPNLNIIERLWLVMKKETVFNRHYEEFTDFRKAILGFFQNRLWDRPHYEKFLSDNFHIMDPDFSGFKMT